MTRGLSLEICPTPVIQGNALFIWGVGLSDRGHFCCIEVDSLSHSPDRSGPGLVTMTRT